MTEKLLEKSIHDAVAEDVSDVVKKISYSNDFKRKVLDDLHLGMKHDMLQIQESLCSKGIDASLMH